MSRLNSRSTHIRTTEATETDTPESRSHVLKRRRSLIAIGLMALVGLALSVWFLFKPPGSSTANETSSVQYLPVSAIELREEHAYSVRRSYSGTVNARRKADLGFEFAGKIQRLLVDQGDRVREGEVLAELDTDILNASRAQLVSQLHAAEALLQELHAGPRREVVAAAAARVKSLEAKVKLGELETQRRVGLVPSGSISKSEYDTVRLNLESNAALLDQARIQLEELTNGTRIEQIQSQQANVDRLANSIKEMDLRIEKSRLLAPFHGTISKRFVDDAVVVNDGQPLFRLVEHDALEAWIGLPANVAMRLVSDSSYEIKVEGSVFDAQLSRRIPEIDPVTQTRLIVFEIETSSYQQAMPIVDGQVAKLLIEEQISQNGFWLPVAALQKDARGLWSCFMLAESIGNDRRATRSSTGNLHRLERRFVEVLHSDGDRAFVRGTVSQGEQVVSSGVHRLVIGQTVQLTNNDHKSAGVGELAERGRSNISPGN